MRFENMQILFSADPMLIHRAIIRNMAKTNMPYKLFVNKDISQHIYTVSIKFDSGIYSDFTIMFSDLLQWIDSTLENVNPEDVNWNKMYNVIGEHLVKPINKWIATRSLAA